MIRPGPRRRTSAGTGRSPPAARRGRGAPHATAAGRAARCPGVRAVDARERHPPGRRAAASVPDSSTLRLMTELAARLLPHGAACAGLREPTHVHLVLTGPGGGTWDVAVGVDEWGTVEQLQQFFSDPDLQAFIGSAGDHRHRGNRLTGSVLARTAARSAARSSARQARAGHHDGGRRRPDTRRCWPRRNGHPAARELGRPARPPPFAARAGERMQRCRRPTGPGSRPGRRSPGCGRRRHAASGAATG